MLAIIAAILFFLAAFGVKVGAVSLWLVALGILSLHFVFSWTPWVRQ